MDEKFGLRGSSTSGSLHLGICKRSTDFEEVSHQIQCFWPSPVRVGQSASSPGITSEESMSQTTILVPAWPEPISILDFEAQQDQVTQITSEIVCTSCEVTLDYCQNEIECLGAWVLSTENIQHYTPQGSNSRSGLMSDVQNLSMINPDFFLFNSQMQVLLHPSEHRFRDHLDRAEYDPRTASTNQAVTSVLSRPLPEPEDGILISSPPELQDSPSLPNAFQISTDQAQLLELKEAVRTRDAAVQSPQHVPMTQKRSQRSSISSEWIVLTADSYQGSQIRPTRVRRAEQQENRRRVRASGGACPTCRRSKRRCSPRHQNVSINQSPPQNSDDQSRMSASSFVLLKDRER